MAINFVGIIYRMISVIKRHLRKVFEIQNSIFRTNPHSLSACDFKATMDISHFVVSIKLKGLKVG
jgi:hypothetical protein